MLQMAWHIPSNISVSATTIVTKTTQISNLVKAMWLWKLNKVAESTPVVEYYIKTNITQSLTDP